MELKKGMLCKHFKGKDLYDKNIYQVLEINVSGNTINWDSVTYTGDGEFLLAEDLVIYQNIVDEKIFAREYSDLTLELSKERQEEYHQQYRIEPLTESEINIVSNPTFLSQRKSIKGRK